MNALLIVSVTLFIAYLALLFKIDRSPESISDSFYIFNKHRRGLGHIFTLWCFTIMLLVAPQMFEASNGRWFQFIGLFTTAGLGFVGAAPYFKDHEKILHTVAAVLCAFGGFLWMTLMGYALIPIILILVVVFLNVFKFLKGVIPDDIVLWLELAIFFAMFITLSLV